MVKRTNKEKNKMLKAEQKVEPQPEPEPEPEPEPQPEPQPKKEKKKKEKKQPVKKKKKKKEVEVFPELEFVEVEEVITINNPKSKRHGQTIKRVSKQLKNPIKWLEIDYNKVSDNDLENVNYHASINPPELLGIDFMLQLIARGSTIETAKSKWTSVCKDLKTDIDLINHIKKEEKNL